MATRRHGGSSPFPCLDPEPKLLKGFFMWFHQGFNQVLQRQTVVEWLEDAIEKPWVSYDTTCASLPRNPHSAFDLAMLHA